MKKKKTSTPTSPMTTIEKLDTKVENLIIHVESTPGSHVATLRTTIPNADQTVTNAFRTDDPSEFDLDVVAYGKTMEEALSKLDDQIEAGCEEAVALLIKLESQRKLSPSDERKKSQLEQRVKLLHDYLFTIGRTSPSPGW